MVPNTLKEIGANRITLPKTERPGLATCPGVSSTPCIKGDSGFGGQLFLSKATELNASPLSEYRQGLGGVERRSSPFIGILGFGCQSELKVAGGELRVCFPSSACCSSGILPCSPQYANTPIRHLF